MQTRSEFAKSSKEGIKYGDCRREIKNEAPIIGEHKHFTHVVNFVRSGKKTSLAKAFGHNSKRNILH